MYVWERFISCFWYSLLFVFPYLPLNTRPKRSGIALCFIPHPLSRTLILKYPSWEAFFRDEPVAPFSVFFFSALVPQAYFIGAINFFIVYWVDKYLLLRRWSIKPPIDASILKTIRMLLALVRHGQRTLNLDLNCNYTASNYPVTSPTIMTTHHRELWRPWWHTAS